MMTLSGKYTNKLFTKVELEQSCQPMARGSGGALLGKKFGNKNAIKTEK